MTAPLVYNLEQKFAQVLKFPVPHYKPDPVNKMTAVEWHGKKDMRPTVRPRPTVTDPKDVVVKVTTSTICGSDLHLYHNEFSGLEKGDILGHEAVGIVDSIGPEVKDLKVGDRVVVSAIISCGECLYCKEGKTSLCRNTNPNPVLDEMYGYRLGGVFGYSHLLGGYEGCQAEYVRVPIGDRNCLKIPDTLPDEKAIFLSDVACTGWHANELGEVTEGKSVCVWGCGPVGLNVIMWAKFRGASRIVAIDSIPNRMKLAQDLFGAELIDYTKVDVVTAIKSMFPNGPDVCIEAAGFRFSKSLVHEVQRTVRIETDTPEILTEVIKSVKLGGNVAIIGDYYAYANRFPVGALMEKSITVRGGQVFVQKYWKQLMDYFIQGKADPTFTLTHKFDLDKADMAYRAFDLKEDGVIKLLLKPTGEKERK